MEVTHKNKGHIHSAQGYLFVTCTQEELLQVLQKLMTERQKVKFLEQKLAQKMPAQKESTQGPHDTSQIAAEKEEYKQQVVALKTTITELNEKLENALKVKQEAAFQLTDTSHEIRSELTSARTEIKALKDLLAAEKRNQLVLQTELQ